MERCPWNVWPRRVVSENSDKTRPALTLFKVANAVNTGTHLVIVEHSEIPENIGGDQELYCISVLSVIEAFRRGCGFVSNVSLFLFVIPGLTRNPVFSWIPAGVYPDEDRGGNDMFCCD